MAYKVPYFLVRDGEKLIFNEKDKEFIFYVPEKYFDTSNAIIIGNIVSVFGLLSYQIVDAKGKVYESKLFNYPSSVNTKPYAIEKVKGIKLSKYEKETDYRLLRFRKGDAVILSVKTAQDIVNVEDFYDLFLRGNLPATIPCNEIQNIFQENMKLSGNKYNISTQIIGLVISEIYRSVHDSKVPFRLSKTDDMLAYQTLAVTSVPKGISPFVSITSENWDEGVVGAINIGADGKYSPMEKVLTGEIN